MHFGVDAVDEEQAAVKSAQLDKKHPKTVAKCIWVGAHVYNTRAVA